MTILLKKNEKNAGLLFWDVQNPSKRRLGPGVCSMPNLERFASLRAPLEVRDETPSLSFIPYFQRSGRDAREAGYISYILEFVKGSASVSGYCDV